jgi:hypothetical protein
VVSTVRPCSVRGIWHPSSARLVGKIRASG